ncbi:MAG: site-specific integrase [Alphaproteobacteria bacterium]|nr:site-specific integrase [Alphaproteobacteria bacterium]
MAKQHDQPYRLYKRGKYYHAYISFVAEDGARFQFRETTGKVERPQAEEYCIKRIYEINQKAHRKQTGELPTITVENAFLRYHNERAIHHSKPEQIFKRLFNIAADLKVKYLHEIDKQVLNDYVLLRRQTVKNGTINRELSIISAVKNLADDVWEVQTNRANPLKFKLPESAENIKYLKDWSVAQKIIDNAAPHLKPIIYTALYTGMRLGNILNLKWENIDFSSNTINIKVKDRTKDGGKNLSIPMIAQLSDILNNQPRINEYVFNYNGKKIGDIKHAWHKALERAKLPYVNFHTLRHTAATWILKKTNNLRITQQILGHSDIKTTAKYAHVIDSEKRRALEDVFS